MLRINNWTPTPDNTARPTTLCSFPASFITDKVYLHEPISLTPMARPTSNGSARLWNISHAGYVNRRRTRPWKNCSLDGSPVMRASGQLNARGSILALMSTRYTRSLWSRGSTNGCRKDVIIVNRCVMLRHRWMYARKLLVSSTQSTSSRSKSRFHRAWNVVLLSGSRNVCQTVVRRQRAKRP